MSLLLHHASPPPPLLALPPPASVFEGVSADQVMAFYMDVDHRGEWDDSNACVHYLPAPGKLSLTAAEVAERSYGQSAYLYARTKFPPPMAQREYVYCRRVWPKVDDGGMYCITKACPHPAPPSASCRTVRIDDYASGFVIR